jgi:hypothetical protein
MLTNWWGTYGRRTAQAKYTVRRAIADALRNGNDPDELWLALERLGDLSKPVTGGTLQFAFSEIRNPPDNVHQLRPSTATVRYSEGQALAAKFRAEEQRALESGHNPPQETA